MNAFAKRSLVAASLIITSLSCSTAALAEPAGLDAGISDLQHDWELIQYKTPGPDREARFAQLADKAHELTQSYDARAEPHIWEGIILSSWANAKGGLGALGIVKQARAQYETAIAIDPKALNGAALSSLAVLYYRVPGWPIGFGDKKKAEDLFKQALVIRPGGVDVNYFYADYLVGEKRNDEALSYLERAAKAAPRPGRAIADAGRQDEVKKLMAKISA